MNETSDVMNYQEEGNISTATEKEIINTIPLCLHRWLPVCKLLIIAIFFSLFFLMSGVSVSASSEDDYEYRVSGGEATITEYLGDSPETLVIPDTIGGYPVKVIDSYNSGGYYFGAFDDCRSKHIILPEGVETIRSGAFNSSALKSITIPSSVTYIGEGAFGENLENVHISDLAAWLSIGQGENTQFIFWGSPPRKLYLNGILVEELVIPAGVTSIPAGRFRDFHCIKSVRSHNDLKTVGALVFEGCINLKEVFLSGAITEIGESAFSGCTALSSVEVKGTNVTIRDEAFSECPKLKDVNLHEGITSIGSHAFYRDTALKKLEIPGSVSFASLTIPDNVQEIVFCDGVKSVGLSSYTSLPRQFLQSVTIPSSVQSITIDLDFSIEQIHITDLSAWCESDHHNNRYTDTKLYLDGTLVTDLIIPEGTSKINARSFYGNTNLKKVTIPNSVTSIGKLAFYGCDGLTEVVVPESVKTIGEQAFNCANLVSVTLPFVGFCANIEKASRHGIGYVLGGYAVFEEKNYVPDSLKNVTLLDTCTRIPINAFYGCKNIESITIPGSVTEIELYAFDMCRSLKTVIYTGNDDQRARLNIANDDDPNNPLMKAEWVYKPKPTATTTTTKATVLTTYTGAEYGPFSNEENTMDSNEKMFTVPALLLCLLMIAAAIFVLWRFVLCENRSVGAPSHNARNTDEK